MLHKSTGTLRYDGLFYALKLAIDPQIVIYHRALLPKYLDLNTTRYDPHITVVRIGKEHVPNKNAWFKHQGEKIDFYYDPTIWVDETYAWLDCYSKQLRVIRRELGLPSTRFTGSNFHITIGNFK